MNIPSPSPAPWRFSDVLVLIVGLVAAVALTRGLAMGLSSVIPADLVLPEVTGAASGSNSEVTSVDKPVAPVGVPPSPPPPASSEQIPAVVSEPRRADTTRSAPPASAPPVASETRTLQERLGTLVSPPAATVVAPPPAVPPPAAVAQTPPVAPTAPPPVPEKPAEVVDPDVVWIASIADKLYHRRRDCPSLTGMFKRASLKQLVGHTACSVCVR